MIKSFKAASVAAAQCLNDAKAGNVLLLDVQKTSPLSDYMIVATALSRPHLEALEKKLSDALSDRNMSIHHRARPQTDLWRVLDYGGLIIHLMTEDSRELYGLERLHGGAKTVTWRKQSKIAAKAAA